MNAYIVCDVALCVCVYVCVCVVVCVLCVCVCVVCLLRVWIHDCVVTWSCEPEA